MLGNELGLDPGPALQDLERRVFSRDTSLLLDTTPAARPWPRANRISRPLTTFCGRGADLHALADLIEQERLVTICGPGGVGKTRLAVEWAAGQPASTGPVWLVRLTDLDLSATVPETAARAAGLLEVGADPVAALSAAVDGQSGTLILDNCEHFLNDVTSFILSLLDVTTDLTIVTTSREPLQVDGEAVFALNPLAIIGENGSDGPAVELLQDRIAKIRPGWKPSATELKDLRQLCTLLDGLPLAVELAAARARSLNLRDIIERLDGRFRALAEVPTGSVAAHRTLADTIAWSTDMLTPADRMLIDRLWAFEGGFDVELAIAVASPASSDSVLHSLSSLVTKSLITADTGASPTRYRLWETVRAYIREQDPQPGLTPARQAASIARLVSDNAQVLSGSRSSRAMTALTRELANIRVMLQHDLLVDPGQALRSFVSIGWFWYRSGLSGEGLCWVEQLAAAAPDAPQTDRARLLAVAATLHHAAGSWDAVVQTLRLLALELAELPESPLHGQACYYQALVAAAHHRYNDALILAANAVEVGIRTSDPTVQANGHLAIGMIRLGLGEFPEGESALDAATSLALNGGTPWTAGMSALHLGRSLLDQPTPRLDDAERALRRAASVFSDEADIGNLTETMAHVSRLLTARGRSYEANNALNTVARAARRLGIRNHDQVPVTAELRTTNHATVDLNRPTDSVVALHSLATRWLTTATTS